MTKIFFSSGKVILSGEHSVVYGEPALVCAIDLGIEAFLIEKKDFEQKPPALEKKVSNFKLQQKSEYLNYIYKIFFDKFSISSTKFDNLFLFIKSNLPMKSGLGSSAAFAHVVFLCLHNHFNKKASKKEIFELVKNAEMFLHKKSSGVDPSAVVFGGLQVYKNDNSFEIIKINKELNFFLVNSGIAQESTGEMVVKIVGKSYKSNKRIPEVIKEISQLTSQIIQDVKKQSFNPKLLTKNQRLLEELGVVGKQAADIVHQIELIGGHAKVTGGGGVKKGSGWLLVFHEDEKVLNSFLSQNRIENYKIKVK